MKKASSRKSSELPDELVRQLCEFESLLLTGISKLPRSAKIWRRGNFRLSNRFGKLAGKIVIHRNIDLVIGYDSNCTAMFKMIKNQSPETITVMDTTIAVRPYQQEVFEQDYEKNGDAGILKEQSYLHNPSIQHAIAEELKYTDYFLAGSDFVKHSLIKQGIKADQIEIVHYGANVSGVPRANRNRNLKTLQLLYVGQITFRKGMHHLLKVVSQLDPEQIHLRVVGQVDKQSDLYRQYKNASSIEFSGFLSGAELEEAYAEADAFIMASLVEGFSMAIIEAMASSLPVIVSRNTGAEDVVIDGVNGFLFDAGDEVALSDTLHQVLNQRSQLPEMGENARKSVQDYTWKNYSTRLNNILESWVNARRER